MADCARDGDLVLEEAVDDVVVRVEPSDLLFDAPRFRSHLRAPHQIEDGALEGVKLGIARVVAADGLSAPGREQQAHTQRDSCEPERFPFGLLTGRMVGRQRLELWTRGLKVPFRPTRANNNQQSKPHNSRGLREFTRPLLLAVLGGS